MSASATQGGHKKLAAAARRAYPRYDKELEIEDNARHKKRHDTNTINCIFVRPKADG